MAEIKVADVSRWQNVINFDVLKTEVDAVVIKVGGSDGGLYVDGQFARNRNEARRVGLPRWFYWYKGAAGSPEEQAAYFIQAIGGLQAGEGVVLDDENEAAVNVDFAARFADKVKELTGLNNVLYSNQARFSGNLQPIKDRNIGAWSAKYGSNSGSPEGAPATAGGLVVIMWQYTSRAVLKAVTGNTVDMNIFYGDVAAFLKYGAPGSVPAPSVPVTPTQPAPGDGYYTVVSGDGLIKIGQKLNLDWQLIARWNGLVAPYTIYPGQRLKVFGGAAGTGSVPNNGATYTVVSGDTLSGIGVKTGHNWQDIANLNGIPSPYTIYPKQVLKLPGGAVATPKESTYTVVSGDYLVKIGEKTGKAWQDIARVNNIPAPYTIYPNQVLRLP
jgi:LysM repeat protein